MKVIVLDRSGHTELDEKEMSQEKMRDEFNNLIAKGYLAYSKSDGVNTATRVFDAEADEIIMHAPMVGG